MRRPPPSGPRGTLVVDWAFFGELSRALALHVAREYQPEVVLGIAKAGVIPGAVVASILQCDFASMIVTRQEAGGGPGSGGRPARLHSRPAGANRRRDV